MDNLSNLKSAADVGKLSAKDLDAILKKHGKHALRSKRGHKIVLVCELLGIKDEPGTFQHVLNEVKQSKHGWTKDIRKCPTVTLAAVGDYLLRAHDTVTHTDSGHIETFTVENMKRYKTLRSFELYRSGHVHSMTYLPMGDGDRCAVKGLCNPSFDTSGTMYECIVLFDRTEERPIISSCTCTAGMGEACTHVAALLFAMEDFTSQGHHQLPDDPATTEILCAWNAPKESRVVPVPLEHVSFEQRAPSRPTSKYSRKHLKDFHPAAPNKRMVDPDRYAALVHDLSLCQPDVPFLTIAKNTASSGIILTADTLPNVMNEYCTLLLPASSVTVETSELEIDPKPVLELAKEFICGLLANRSTSLKEIIKMFVISAECQYKIEQLTMGQSANKQWHKYRKGVVTGTLIHAVKTRMASIRSGKAVHAEHLVKQCLGLANFKGSAATRYGLVHECVAVKQYYALKTTQHCNFRLNTCGLVLDCEHCFIGASPDRVAYCDCHGSWIVEIKCPASMEKMPKGSFYQLPFIQNTTGPLQLRTNHQYYSQVMLYMAVCKKAHTELVLWSPNEMAVINVDFSEPAWQELRTSALYFYEHFMVPALLEENRKQWLPSSQ